MIALIVIVFVIIIAAIVKSYYLLKKLIMANITQLTEKVDALQTALDAEQEQIKAAIDELNAAKAELEVMIAEGGTTEQRQALADKLDGVITDLKGTIPDETDTGTGDDTGSDAGDQEV